MCMERYGVLYVQALLLLLLLLCCCVSLSRRPRALAKNGLAPALGACEEEGAAQGLEKPSSALTQPYHTRTLFLSLIIPSPPINLNRAVRRAQ